MWKVDAAGRSTGAGDGGGRRRARRRLVAAGAVATIAALAAAGYAMITGSTAGSGGQAGGAAGSAVTAPRSPAAVQVVTAFYPLEYLARRIGGDRVSVVNLVKPGVEPHDVELNPVQARQVAAARLVLYLHGFQPAVDAAVAAAPAGRALDAATVQPLVAGPEGPGPDPHVWLDPVRYAAIGDRVAARLAAIDPAGAAGYQARDAALRADLMRLDARYATALRTCQRDQIVTSHAAFGYLARRYRLVQVAITGLVPDSEPTPRRLAEAATMARRTGATTIFFEPLVSPRIAWTLAAEVGARPMSLDPIEGLQPHSTADYFSLMGQNLTRISQALGCRS